MSRVRSTSGIAHHPGCSPSELEGYDHILRKSNLTNAWEYLYPYSSQGMTWHPPTDPHGLLGWGQRLDHFLVTPEFLSSSGKYRLGSIMNLRGEGSSDHNGLLLELLDSSELPVVSLLTDDSDNSIVIMNVDTGASKAFKAVECPRVSFEIGGFPTQALLDSGAPFSIYNPPGKLVASDCYLTSAIATGSLVNCSFTGATGGSVTAEQNYLMNFKIGSHSLRGNFVVLSSHERNLPLFLFGMDLLMGPLQGVAVAPDLKDQLDKLSVYFGSIGLLGIPAKKS